MASNPSKAPNSRKTRLRDEAEPGAWDEGFGLLPMQRWFFEPDLPSPGHCAQAVLLRLEPGVTPAGLREVVGALVARHDALRSRFERVDTEWVQHSAEAAAVPFEEVDLSSVPAEQRAAEITRHAEGVQSALHPTDGHLFVVVHYELGNGEPARLLLAAHSLVIDGASWRVLLEDLERGLEHVRGGDRVQLPPRTTSVQAWWKCLRKHASSSDLRASAEWWLNRPWKRVRELPVDGAASEQPHGAVQHVIESLTADDTRVLLTEGTAVHGASPGDVLLAALARALEEWTGSGCVAVDLWAEGREAALDDVDLSRTVGCLTSAYPIVLDVRGVDDSDDLLARVVEQRRAVPNGGLDFGVARSLGEDAALVSGLAGLPRPQVSFHYVEPLEQLGERRFWTGAADEPPGRLHGDGKACSRLIDVTASVTDGRLALRFRFNAGVHSRSTIEGLAARCAEVLRTFVEDVGSGEGTAPTAADHSVVELDQATLDVIAACAGSVAAIYRPSPMQQGLIFHTLYAPNASTSVVQFSLSIAGELDVDAFRRAWSEVVARHGALRTLFVTDREDRAVQVVVEAAEMPWTLDDWSSLSGAQQDDRLAEFLRDDRARGFALDRAPLARGALLRCTDTVHRFVWSVHHAIIDGWSTQVVVGEVLRIYRGIRDGRPAALPAARQFGDYIDWLSRQDLAHVEAYWRDALAGVVASTALPWDHQPAERVDQASSGRSITHIVEAAATEALESFARRHRLTLNTVLLGAWAVLLSRLSGEDEVIFGTTQSGRPPSLPGVEGIVGAFINSLPTRVAVEEAVPVVTWLARLQLAQAEQREHEYASLVDVQSWSGLPRGTPLFQTLVVYENYPALRDADRAGGDLELRAGASFEATNYPLTLVAARRAAGLSLRFLYDPRWLDQASAERILTQCRTLLTSLAEDRDRVADLSMLQPEEERLVLDTWNATDRDYPRASVARLFEEVVGRHGERCAVALGDERLSYRALDERANRIANYLRKQGVVDGTLVGVYLDRGMDLIAAMLGILKAGGAYVPFDTSYPRERLAFMLEDSSTPVLLTARQIEGELPAHGGRLVVLDAEREAIDAEPVTPPVTECGADSLAYVMYTSGSTGRPKGVMVPHRGITRLVFGVDYATFDESCVTLQLAPTSFDASTLEIWGPLLHGGKVALYPDRVPTAPRLREELERHEVTTLWLTASLFNVVIDESPQTLAGVEELLTGGEALSVPHVRRGLEQLPATQLVNGYGPTESTTFTCCWRIPRDLPGDVSSIALGPPIGNTRVYVLDRRGHAVPVGVVGELYIGGDGLAWGYHRRPALTAERFVPDPFGGRPGATLYRTGDLARWTKDGIVEFVGRDDGQVKIRGFRIETGEIEHVLVELPAVREAAVLARGDARGDKRLVAYVVLSEHGSSLAEVRDALGDRLPEYMVPSAFVVLDALPITPNGKLDRSALPEPGEEHAGGYVAPRSGTEEVLCAMCEQVLGHARVGVHDDFFDLGGHSLLATQLVSRIRSVLGVELPLRALFDTPTVAGIEVALREVTGRPARPPLVAVPRERPPPLSFSQQRLWFLDRLGSGSAYNIPVVLRLEGELDRAALQRTLDEIVRRHEALRTTFAMTEGGPVQVVGAPFPVPLETVDLGELDPAARGTELRRVLREEAARPFDLAVGPLLRTILLRLGARDHALALTMHHIVSDGWSMGVLLGELGALYSAFSRGRAADLEELKVQYPDFACWQRGWLGGELLENEIAWWRSRLAGAPVLELPTDRPRPPVQGHDGAASSFEVPERLATALQEYCRRERVTPAMVTLAAFQLLLSKASGQDDVVVGSPIANRNAGELESLIGCFINTLVLRTDLSGDPTFEELVRRVRRVALDAYEHQDVPFEKLVDELDPERDLARPPLFQVLFGYLNTPRAEVRAGDLEVRALDSEIRTSAVDLELALAEQGSVLAGSMIYNRELFDASTIERWIARFLRLLESGLGHPSRRLSELSLLDEAERTTLLEVWSGASRARGDVVRRPVHEWFEEQKGLTPDAVAVESAARAVTYRELDESANRLARCLRQRGVGAEAPVGVCLEQGVELVVGMLAILKAGGVYLPLDSAAPRQRLAFVIEDSRATTVLTRRGLLDDLPAIAAGVVCLEDLESELEAQSDGALGVPVDPEQLAYVIYTSGSTGAPKGVMVPHRALCNHMAWILRAYPLSTEDRVLQNTSPSFDVSLSEVWSALLSGGCLVIAPAGAARDPGWLVQTLRERGVTSLELVPTLLRALLAIPELAECRSLRRVIAGGEVLPTELVDAVAARLPAMLVNGYGPTETAITATSQVCEPGGDRPSAPIGVPVDNLRAYVLDRWMEPVPVGVPGELYLGGEGLARGYLNRPDATAERFVPDPGGDGERLYRTGDLVQWLAGGRLEFSGRIDHQVKVRGFRIELGEIEAAALRCGGVRDAVALVREDRPGEQRIVLYIEHETAAAPGPAAVREQLALSLPDYMVPAFVVVLEALPQTASGKIDRNALPAPDAGSAAEDYVAPRNGTEATLARIWSDVLGVDRVGANDHFFRLGGDSIMSIQVIAAARRAGLLIKPDQVFRAPTLGALAACAELTGAFEPEEETLVGPLPLLPIQRWFLESELASPGHFNQALMLAIDSAVSSDELRGSLRALVLRHDVLRSRFRRGVDGWEQEVDASVPEGLLDEIDLSGLGESERGAALEAAVAHAQADCDLAAGRLFRGVRIELGAPAGARLLLIANHLVIDGVSWRILLEHLALALDQVRRGEPVALPPRTTSVRAWVERLAGWAATEPAQEMARWWLDRPWRGIGAIPRDRSDGENTGGSVASVTVGLDVAATRALLAEAARAYNMRTDDVLVAAFAETIAEWTGSHRIAVDLEGHGREDLFDDVDLSSTVGWFTSLYPVLLDVEGLERPEELLMSVKEQLRAVPRQGLPFGVGRYLSSDAELREALAEIPRPEISFNYLGRFAGEADGRRGMRLAAEPVGPTEAEENLRSHLLDVTASIGGDRLRVRWDFSAAAHDHATIEEVAQRFVARLRALIAQAAAAESTRFTPSDFPMADLTQERLDRIVEHTAPASVESIYPLAPLQQGMVFHTLTSPGSGLYVVQLGLRLDGELDAGAMRRAWEAVVARHSTLRTFFALDTAAPPLQVVADRVDLPWTELDLRSVNDAEHDARIRAWLADDLERGFELAHVPLMRVGLIRTDDRTHHLVWTAHHALQDGWSGPIVLGEVFRVYEAQLAGESLELPPTRPYSEYIEWMLRQDRGAATDHWRRTLAGFESPTSFPWDRAGGVRADDVVRPEVVASDVDASATAAVRELGHRYVVTPSTVVHAAWALVLSRYTGEADVVFGSTVSGRPPSLPGVETMVGPFINTLPVRVGVGQGETVAAWLQRLQEAQNEARSFDYSSLVDIQRCSDVPRGTPLFESLLVYENYPLPRSSSTSKSALRAELSTAHDNTNYALSLAAHLESDRLVLRLDYDGERLHRKTAERLVGQVARLIADLAENPGARVGELSVVSGEERTLLLEAWSGKTSRRPATRGRCVHEWFEEQAARTPDAVAVECGDRVSTYRELDRRGNQLARHLQSLGVGPDVLVGVCLERSLEFVVAVLGILKAGGGYVPLDPRYPAPRLAYLLEDVKAPVVLAGRGLLEDVPGLSIPVVCLEEAWPEIAAQDDGPVAGGAGPESLAYVIYTSGSTGAPKGVMVPHRALCYHNAGMLLAHPVVPDDRAVHNASTTFDASVWEMWSPLLVGARLVIAAPEASRDPELLVQTLRRHGVTVLDTVPTLIRALLSTPGFAACRSLRRVVSGGEPLPTEVVDALAAQLPATVVNAYGPTEATITASLWECEAGRDGAIVPIGRALEHVRFYVLDRWMNLVPPGVPGELFIGGGQLARGYLGRPEITAESFVPDPFGGDPGARLYRTGDLVRHREDGALEFVGRRDHQVKVRGFRIELGEIESAALQCVGVREAVAAVREERPGERRLVLYVTPAPDGGPDQRVLREHIAGRLPEYMVPSLVMELEALPLTSSGKVDRKALPRPDVSSESRAAPYVAPRSDAERTLCRIWSEVLGVDRIGVHDDYFELGGDSILTIQIVGAARQQDLRLTPRQVFEHPTVARLAAAATRGTAERADGGPLQGPVEALPLHRGLAALAEPWHFNQGVMLSVQEEVPRARLRAALDALVTHHDALRLRCLLDGDKLREEIAPATERASLQVVDARGCSTTERRSVIEDRAGEVQAEFDLRRGPLFKAVLFDAGGGGADRLLLVAHHLVIDVVSWRIVLEDLATALDQLRRGEAVRLAPKSSSVQEWGKRLGELAAGGELLAEAEYWRGLPWDAVAPLPVETAAGPNEFGTLETTDLEFDEEETQAVLRELPQAFHSQIDDVLLTAWVEALAWWTGSRCALVEFEGHGREELFEDVDLTRTVGWFTSAYPLVLDVRGAAGLVDALQRVKQQRRALPRRGIGFGILRELRPDGAGLRSLPRAEVSFNYLGQFQSAPSPDALFGPVEESVGPSVAPRNARGFLLEVTGGVHRGRLRLQLGYSRNLHRSEAIEALGQRMAAALRDLIAEARFMRAVRYTTEDFPLAGLDQSSLDRLVDGLRSAAAEEGTRADVESIFPVTPMQHGMAFHWRSGPEQDVYFRQTSLRVRGSLDATLFRDAWQEVVRRHGALRTAFASHRADLDLQVVLRDVRLPWHEEDLAGLAAEEQLRRIREWAAADRRRGFDLERAPLMRVAVFRRGDEEHELLWSLHHSINDGWSTPIVLYEVFALYEAARRGAAADLPQARPYEDFVTWLLRQDRAAAEAFWRQKLGGIEAPTSFPWDRVADGGADSSDSATLWFTMPQRASRGLDRLAREHGLTASTILHGAWAMLLSRYGGEDDVVFGSTVSGRPAELEGVERMVGLFINSLPTRITVDRDASVVGWLQDVQRELLAMRQFEHSALVEVQGYSGVRRGTPMFETLVVYENYPIVTAGDPAASTLRWEMLGTEESTNFPLALFAGKHGQELALGFVYHSSRLREDTVRRVSRHLVHLLECIASRPQAKLAELGLLDDAERRRILVDWNATAMSWPRDARVQDLVEARVAEAPGAAAATCGGDTITYAELNARANRLARHLRSLGAGPQSLVGISVERSLDMVVGLLGILKSGAAYVPLDPKYPRDRLSFIMEDAGIEVLVTQATLLDALPSALPRLVRLDADAAAIAAQSAGDLERLGSAGDLAYVIYTSGSTGRPKGVQIEHRALVNFLLSMAVKPGLTSDDVLVAVTTISFDIAALELYLPLLVGGRLIVAGDGVAADGHRLAELLADSEASVMQATPATWRLLVEAGWRGGPGFKALCGGEALPRELAHELLSRSGELWNLYGPTETTVWSLAQRVEPGDGPVPIGRPIANTEVYVLDRDRQPVPIGVPGGLFLGGAGLARGYWNRPGLTAEKFVPHPFSTIASARLYRTGDVARYRADGVLEFLGRDDHQVKLRGFRIELGEIESIVVAYPGVSACVVQPYQVQADDKRLVAYVVAGNGEPPSSDEMRAFLRKSLPEYMVPAAFVLLDALPTTPNGKVDRNALPAPDESQARGHTGHVPPETAMEKVLADIWQEVLGVAQVSVNDNFLDLGGHSLLILRVSRELERRTGARAKIDPVFFFVQTLRQLAGNLEEGVERGRQEGWLGRRLRSVFGWARGGRQIVGD